MTPFLCSSGFYCLASIQISKQEILTQIVKIAIFRQMRGILG